MQQAETNDSTGPENPHCTPQWPYGHFNDRCLERLVDAAHGAHALTTLLKNDETIRCERDQSDTPADEPQPFTPYCRAGLLAALYACMETIVSYSEHMEEVSA